MTRGAKIRCCLRLCLLSGVLYGGLSFWNQMTLTCACASKLSEAKASLGAMGRAQQWHFQEKGAFNPDWLSMEPILGAPAETESYRYSLQMVSDKLYGFAIAQDPTELRNVAI